jgi:hypothetical protein
LRCGGHQVTKIDQIAMLALPITAIDELTWIIQG